MESDTSNQRHHGADRPWDAATERGPMPATVESYRREHPDHWEALRRLAGQYPFVRLLEEPVKESVLPLPTTVSIDVVLGWPIAEQNDDGAVWGDVVQVRLETPGRRYPLGGIMAYVKAGVLEREAFREHLPETGAITWDDDFAAWLDAMDANMVSMGAALKERGWLTPDGLPPRE